MFVMQPVYPTIQPVHPISIQTSLSHHVTSSTQHHIASSLQFVSSTLERKDFSKNPEVIVHASSTSRLFEIMNNKTKSSDRKIGLGGVTANGGCRSLNDIMTELNSSIVSLDSAGQSEDNSSMLEGSSCTTGGSVTGGSMTESMADLAAEDMISALRSQRAALLERRADMQMRIIHLENDEAAILSGQRLQDVAGHEWSRKHVNTGFSINSPNKGIGTMDEISQLEFDVEIQQKIVNAARRLAREHGIRRNAKRERKMAAQRALLKLQDLERKLQCAKRFQCPPNKITSPPTSPGCGNIDSVQHDKLKQHESYYKAVADNGYYPTFRSSRTISSTSEDKGSFHGSIEQVESDSGSSVPSSLPPTPLISSSRESSVNSLTTNSQDSVRACLQMTLNSDTKTLPRKRIDSRARHSISTPPSPPCSQKSISPSVFNPSSVRIENLNISGNEKSFYKGSDNPITDNIHSYDRYLQTLRQNRQRNGHYDCNQNRRHSLEIYGNKSLFNGHQDHNISAISTHSTAV